MLHGIQPGPQVLGSRHLSSTPCSLRVHRPRADVCDQLFRYPAAGEDLDFPEAVVSAYVLILCFIGALSIRNNITDLWLIIIWHSWLRFRTAEIPCCAARTRRDSRSNRRRSVHEHDDQFFQRLDGVFYAADLRNHRRVDGHRLLLPSTAFTEEPSGDGFESRLVSHAYQSWI